MKNRKDYCGAVIELSSSLLFGRGHYRECYIHPLRHDLCVKIFRKQNKSKQKRQIRYYRYLEQRNISWEMMPRFHGIVDTNLGPGMVFDLIRDYDDEISKPLNFFLTDPDIIKENYHELL